MAPLSTTGDSNPSPSGQPVRARSREEIARYLLDNGDRIRAIARRKLTKGTKSVCDSEDVLASVLRRVDDLVRRGWLQVSSEDELWGLVVTITRNNAVDRTRLIERARSMLTEDGAYAYQLVKRLNSYSTNDQALDLLYRMMLCLKIDTDRQILNLLLRGASHRAIGTMLGITEVTSRQRWRTIKEHLNARFEEGMLDG